MQEKKEKINRKKDWANEKYVLNNHELIYVYCILHHWLVRTMVLVLDGNSELGVHVVSDFG